MRRIIALKFITPILAVFSGGVVLIALIGSILPHRHTATRAAVYRRTPAELFAVMENFAAMPSWRSGLTGVDILPPNEGRASFREDSGRRPITFVVLENRPSEKLVLKIADEKLPFGGTWTYEISSEAGGARLRITEDGEIRNALFRFLSRFVFGYTATMDTYLRDLGKKFGETVTPAT
jgi:hypothetical protein